MQIAERKVATIEYTVKDDAGQTIDSSVGRDPLVYLHGVGTLVPGLEKALSGKSAGYEIETVVAPDEGYGTRDERLVRKVPLRKLGDKQRPQVGGRYRLATDEGVRVVTITQIRGDYATVDGNHPLCDKTLHFTVKVIDVRDATDEEIAHGHAHGPGGHGH